MQVQPCVWRGINGKYKIKKMKKEYAEKMLEITSFFMLLDVNKIDVSNFVDSNGKELTSIGVPKLASNENDFQVLFDKHKQTAKGASPITVRDNLLQTADCFLIEFDSIPSNESRPHLALKDMILNFKNWLENDFVFMKDEGVRSVVYFELSRVKEKFFDDKLFEKAVSETYKFFDNNQHRAKQPIVTNKGANTIAQAYNHIRLRVGRNEIALSKDKAYLEFLKSLFVCYKDYNETQLIKAMQRN